MHCANLSIGCSMHLQDNVNRSMFQRETIIILCTCVCVLSYFFYNKTGFDWLRCVCMIFFFSADRGWMCVWIIHVQVYMLLKNNYLEPVSCCLCVSGATVWAASHAITLGVCLHLAAANSLCNFRRGEYVPAPWFSISVCCKCFLHLLLPLSLLYQKGITAGPALYTWECERHDWSWSFAYTKW